MKTGIMGGTFDPVHHGHLFLAQEVMTEYQLDRVVFVPSKIGPHKLFKHHTPPKLRYQMLCAATKNHMGFEVSDIEIKRRGISYTIDTIKAFEEIYPSDAFFFITGADAIISIETWRDFKTLLQTVTFIAATRPSLDDNALKREIKRLNHAYRAKIIMMELLDLEISSSNIRDRVGRCKPIKYLVPDVVAETIDKEALYESDFKADR